MSDSADPATSPSPPMPSQLSNLTIEIVNPTGTGTEASPLVMNGWFEPRDVDEVKVWYTRNDGSNGEPEVTPTQTPDPGDPGRMLWNKTFANNLVSGHVYIAYARVKRGLVEDEKQVTFTAQ